MNGQLSECDISYRARYFDLLDLATTAPSAGLFVSSQLPFGAAESFYLCGAYCAVAHLEKYIQVMLIKFLACTGVLMRGAKKRH